MTIQVYPYNQEEENETGADFLDRYNKELEESEAQIDAGNCFTHDEVKQFFADKRKQISGS